jgi:hypothetical protein
MMEPWYKVATPRKEVREGRTFNPDEFTIALEQVVAGTAPDDYKDLIRGLGSDQVNRLIELTISKKKRLISGLERRF